MAPRRTTIAMGIVACATVAMAIREEVLVRRAAAAEERWFPPQEQAPPARVEPARPSIDDRVAKAIDALRAALHDNAPALLWSPHEDKATRDRRLLALREVTESEAEWIPESRYTAVTLAITKSDIADRLCAELSSLVHEKWGEPSVYRAADEWQTWTSFDARKTATFIAGPTTCQLRLMPWEPMYNWLRRRVDAAVPAYFLGKRAVNLRNYLRSKDIEILLDTDTELRWRVPPTSTMYYLPVVSFQLVDETVTRLTVIFSAPPATVAEINEQLVLERLPGKVEQSVYDPMTYDLVIDPALPLQRKTP